MKNFYVQVLKCSKDGYWYKDLVGEIFLVRRCQNKLQYECLDGCSWISKKDCRIFDVEGMLGCSFKDVLENYKEIQSNLRRDRI